MRTKPRTETNPMKTELEISEYLQKQRGPFEHDGPKRELHVAFGTGYYGDRSTAMIEVEGSPIKGLAVVVAQGPLGDVGTWNCDIWVQRPGNKMRHLPHRSREAVAIAEWTIARSKEDAAQGHLSP